MTITEVQASSDIVTQIVIRQRVRGLIGTGDQLRTTMPRPSGWAHAINVDNCAQGDKRRAGNGLSPEAHATAISMIRSPAPERLTISIEALLVDAVVVHIDLILVVGLPRDEPTTVA